MSCRSLVPPRSSLQLAATLATTNSFFNALNVTATPSSLVIVSNCTNIYTNLAFEEWILRNSPFTLPILLLYRNDPCVVIGRHQNPWTEASVDACQKHGIPIVRRHSGGGTVYHDLGNVNYAYYSSRSEFSRTLMLDFLLERYFKIYLPHLSVQSSPHHDLFLRSKDDTWRKISGSAYRVIRERAYHHGTMLITSQLAQLSAWLRPSLPDSAILTSAKTPSRRSPVANLSDVDASMTTDSFIKHISTAFLGYFSGPGIELQIDPTKALSVDLQNDEQELKSHDWNFGKTPHFTLQMSLAFANWKGDESMTISKGLISEIHGKKMTPHHHLLQPCLGQPFSMSIVDAIQDK